jgi:hypothetical protein
MKISYSKFWGLPLSALLLFLFCCVVLASVVMAYIYILPGFSDTDVVVPDGSVVRINLRDYQNTVNYLEQLYLYQPPELVLPKSNPFVSAENL